MKFFIDTANVEEIKEAADLGLVDGVTTNPSLLAMENREFDSLVREICGLVEGPVSLEVVGTEAAGMVDEGKKLAAISDNVVIKIPMTAPGMQAVGRLAADGIGCNVTLVFSANQALMAAKAGAAFVSPFVGRIDDTGGDGMGLISEILDIYANYVFSTEIIVASVRHPGHVLESAMLGADIATVPTAILKKLFNHPLTDVGIERFLEDWKNVPSNG